MGGEAPLAMAFARASFADGGRVSAAAFNEVVADEVKRVSRVSRE